MLSVNHLSEPVKSDVELPEGRVEPMGTSNEERVVDVSLHDPKLTRALFLQENLSPFKASAQSDASTSVAVFAWLADPDSVYYSCLRRNLLELKVHILTASHIIRLWQLKAPLIFIILLIITFHRRYQTRLIR